MVAVRISKGSVVIVSTFFSCVVLRIRPFRIGLAKLYVNPYGLGAPHSLGTAVCNVGTERESDGTVGSGRRSGGLMIWRKVITEYPLIGS